MKTTNKRREYARRIHWYVQSFLFCLHNKLQTEKEYREGKYGSKVQTYFIEITCATSAEISRISTETAETTMYRQTLQTRSDRLEMYIYIFYRI